MSSRRLLVFFENVKRNACTYLDFWGKRIKGLGRQAKASAEFLIPRVYLTPTTSHLTSKHHRHFTRSRINAENNVKAVHYAGIGVRHTVNHPLNV